MKDKLLSVAKSLRLTRLPALAEYLLRDEAISGKLILAAVGLALIAANTPFAPWYDALLHSEITLGVGDWHLTLSLQHWISEGLMMFFFLVVGLELKRELLQGELRHRKTAILPFAAAIGGMLVPALIYVAFNIGKDTIVGWAIPTATDIALAVGVLALLGNIVPSSVRIFILALAIVDDILAVVVIATFYNSSLDLLALAGLLVVAIQLFVFGRLKWLPMWLFVVEGVLLWLLAFVSGVHPAIAGVLLGLVAPLADGQGGEEQLAEKAERAIIPFSTLVVVPLFAFVSSGVHFDLTKLHADTIFSVGGGIVAGLVIGKTLGIVSASWIMVKLGFAQLPEGARWLHILGTGSLAGIGFTVAIFVADLAFKDESLIMTAKLGIFVASILAAFLGLMILKRIRA